MRVRSWDILRGIAIFNMIITHGCLYWLDSKFIWILPLFRIISNPVLVNLLVFLSGATFSYTQTDNGINSQKKPLIKVLKSSLFPRTTLYFFIALSFNLLVVVKNDFPLEHLFSWYLLQAIVFFRIGGIFFVTLSNRVRISIAILIGAINHSIYALLITPMTQSLPDTFLWQIIYRPYQFGVSPLIFFPFYLIGMNIGVLQQQKGSPFMRKLWKSGVMIILGSLLLGIYPTTLEFGSDLLVHLNLNSSWDISALPLILIRGTGPWCVFSLGWILIAVSITSGINRFPKARFFSHTPINFTFERLGRFSLLIYLSHYLFWLIPFNLTIPHLVVSLLFVVQLYNALGYFLEQKFQILPEIIS